MMVAVEEVPRDFITQESQQPRVGGDSSSWYSPISIRSVLNTIRIGILKKKNGNVPWSLYPLKLCLLVKNKYKVCQQKVRKRSSLRVAQGETLGFCVCNQKSVKIKGKTWTRNALSPVFMWNINSIQYNYRTKLKQQKTKRNSFSCHSAGW